MVAVNPPAVLPDLPLRPRQRRDVAHLHHRLREVLEEEVDVRGVGLDERRRLGALGEQHLVGAEQPPSGQDVLEVEVVEPGRGGEVEREEVVVAAGARASPPQLRRVGDVQRGVRHAVARLVVEPLPEAGAAGHADGVAAGERDDVGDVQALAPELGDDGGERVVGRRDVVVGALDAGAQRVPPPQRHVPGWTADEHRGVARGQGEDVGAGDDARARGLQRGLDLVHDLEATKRVLVGVGAFLAHDAAAVVQQHRSVAALSEIHTDGKVLQKVNLTIMVVDDSLIRHLH